MKILFVAATLIAAATSSHSYGGDQVESYAKSSGYSSCLGAVTDLERFFTKDVNYGSWAFVAKEGTDDQLVNASLELTYGDGTVIVDFTVAPTKDGACSYTYTRTWYNEKSCMATSKEDFMKNATYKAEVNKNVMGFEDGSAKIMLLPAGTGCMIQKKEIGFRHSKQGN